MAKISIYIALVTFKFTVPVEILIWNDVSFYKLRLFSIFSVVKNILFVVSNLLSHSNVP